MPDVYVDGFCREMKARLKLIGWSNCIGRSDWQVLLVSVHFIG